MSTKAAGGRPTPDLTGREFGDWTVVRRGARKARTSCWLCRCVCGTEREVQRGPLVRMGSQGCGCRKRERIGDRTRKHGWRKRPGYKRWRQMIRRCSNPRDSGYTRYGGRGIKVCERWQQSFEAFIADVGLPPSPEHSLDRIDNDGHYEPGNVRWATRVEQARNKSTSHFLEVDGVRKTVAEWSEITGRRATTILCRIKRGWSVRDAVLRPLSA